jgi:hypothetical protein
MKRLEDIALPEQAEWVDRYSTTSVTGTVRFTTAGVPIITEKGLQGGQEITVDFMDGIEWVPEETVIAIKSLEQQVGGVYAFEWDGEIRRVTFNRQKPSNFSKVMPGRNQYIGQIHLISI